MLAEQLLHRGVDPKKVSRLLGWQEFENFSEHMLTENGFSTQKHLVFKSEAGRREIDILAWNDTFMLAVDCKHWLSGLSPGRMRRAAQAQVQRTIALARRPELLYHLKVTHPEKRSIIPLVLTLGELRERLVDRVPVVSVSKLLNFIYGVSPIEESVKRIGVSDLKQSSCVWRKGDDSRRGASTEALNSRNGYKQLTLTEKEQSLQEVTSALVAGNGVEAKQRAYAALAKGNTNGEVLDAIVEAANIVSDLQELNRYDQERFSAVENSVTSCLQVLEEWLTISEEKFHLKVTVGPVGLEGGALSSLALSASLRSVGFHSTSLSKTQTALDLLRNSEELDADLVIPILSGGGDEDLQNFVEAYERGGFRNKFEVIPIAPCLSDKAQTSVTVARNSGEAISKATQWAVKTGRAESSATSEAL
jgi:methylmalonyl-CoA mutase cobalamin-binding subunit